MADTKRQQIVDAVKARLQTILTAGGYRTDAGGNVSEWRASDWGQNEDPGLILRDEDWDSSAIGPGYQDHDLHLSVECVAVGTGTAATVRQMAADVLQAAAVDDTFGGLAIQTVPSPPGADGRHQFAVG